MKELILSFLLILFWASFSWGQVIHGQHGGIHISGVCQATPFFDYSPTTDDQDTLGSIESRVYGGQEMDPGANKCVCKINFKLSYGTGDISSKTYTARIYTLTGHTLNSLLGTSAGVSGDNAWSNTTVSFTFSPCVNVLSGTTYAFVVTTGTYDSSNYARIRAKNADEINGYWATWSADYSQSNAYTTEDVWIQLFSYE